MRELVYYVAVTLDGYIAAPDGGFDAFLVEGDHAPVLQREFGDALPSHGLTALGISAPRTRFDTVVMGWNTYTPALDIGITSPYAHLRQIVASRRDRRVPDEIEITADPLERVRELKQEDGLDIYLCGGGDLAGQLIDEIDRLVLKRNPFAFGSGVPLFGSAPYEARHFAHERTRAFDSGVVVQEYVRDSL
ncbi:MULTISPECIES: dihydrofolate reductase family protein [unclassified Microbacterium]|uniref:dihydrofolate reductase family protein n=1 Tax=Microbacterium TaxID=33882 RepID=UPI003B9FF305